MTEPDHKSPSVKAAPNPETPRSSRRELPACIAAQTESLHRVLAVLEAGAVGIALIVDRTDRLVGTMTDGDVRRALLQGAALEAPLAPFMQRGFTAVPPEAHRAEVLDLMQARTIEQIPIVDDQGRLVGLHLIHELLGAAERGNWAVIMAGGQGIRLRPITRHLPKPMLKVAGRPILERLVLHLVGSGIKRIFLAVNYLGGVIEDHFQDGSRFGCRIDYLREEQPMGTGGALSLLPEAPEEPVVVMNGDLVTQANIAQMLNCHSGGGNAATLAVRRYVHQVPFGCVEVEGNRIIRMEEKPTLTQLINAGIYVLQPHLLHRVPKASFPLPNLLDDSLKRGERVGVFEIAEDWIDVGQHDQLKLAREGNT